VRGEGFTGTDVLAVTVVNISRAPVVIERYSVVLEGSGLSFMPMGDAIGASLPYELQAGRSEIWCATIQPVRALVSSAEAIDVHGRAISMTVDLGSGPNEEDAYGALRSVDEHQVSKRHLSLDGSWLRPL
jgi:hypothetical protein